MAVELFEAGVEIKHVAAPKYRLGFHTRFVCWPLTAERWTLSGPIELSRTPLEDHLRGGQQSGSVGPCRRCATYL